ncbi:MAG: PIN domain-containing protein [Candidatus Scalindua sp.]|nr:PIN domain-containing protein [Candidatus Scalindua sp.]MBT5305897.1 PIN domain-containing protein [Candidatus Scalindua sp.]MBT6052004.1 PIN domain-containing protein [Candidatus Scalindua sp.]MBT6229149.1 PIN domain-containing protein [Candidatus Scalindua sp.]MBT7213515.1 PIN domain-containing protein [Candidatus Scalindua sp.]
MEWLTKLQGKIVGLDTAPLIYFIEEHTTYLGAIKEFFETVDKGEVSVVTSTITLTEVLVHPLRSQNVDLAAEYRDILLNSNITTVDISSDIAEYGALLRSQYNLRTPDALQIATAIKSGAGFFLTNDTKLPKIPNIDYLIMDILVNER